MLLHKVQNIHERMKQYKYMTITAMSCDDSGRFVFSGCHQNIFIYRKALNKIETVGTSGMWIGMLDDITGLEDFSFKLEKGDIILLFTDGITEAWIKGSVPNKRRVEDMFGEERLKEIFHEKSAEGLTGSIVRSILEGLEGYDCNDDVTMVVLKYNGIK